MREVFFGDFDVPFKTASQSCVGDVGRANIRSTESGLSLEEIGFGMEAGCSGVVGDFDFSVWEFGKFDYGFEVGCSHV